VLWWYAINLRSLRLASGNQFSILNSVYQNSKLSFLQVIAVEEVDEGDYEFLIESSNLNSNALSQQGNHDGSLFLSDTLIVFGGFSTRWLGVTIRQTPIKDNTFDIGCVLQLNLNIPSFLIDNCHIDDNFGQFMIASPTSLIADDALQVLMDHVVMERNCGKTNTLIVFGSNSVLNVSSSEFYENYAFKNSPVMGADYQSARIFIENSTFARNYGPSAGVFQAQY